MSDLNATDPTDAELRALILRAGTRWVLYLLVLVAMAAFAVIFERVSPRR